MPCEYKENRLFDMKSLLSKFHHTEMANDVMNLRSYWSDITSCQAAIFSHDLTIEGVSTLRDLPLPSDGIQENI